MEMQRGAVPPGPGQTRAGQGSLWTDGPACGGAGGGGCGPWVRVTVTVRVAVRVRFKVRFQLKVGAGIQASIGVVVTGQDKGVFPNCVDLVM